MPLEVNYEPGNFLPIRHEYLLRRQETFENFPWAGSDEWELNTEASKDTNDEESNESFKDTETAKCSVCLVESEDEERIADWDGTTTDEGYLRNQDVDGNCGSNNLFYA